MLEIIDNGTAPAYAQVDVLYRTVSLQFTGPGLHDLRLRLYEMTSDEARRLARDLQAAADRAEGEHHAR